MESYITNNKKENCSGCGACISICPQKCITMKEDSEGFYYPEIDKTKCTNCKACERLCPIIKNRKTREVETASYAAYNKNTEIRLNSSSGGIFTLLAELILKDNGVVYGASLTSKNRVQHIKVTTMEEISKLRGSKYIQSEINNIFIDVKEELEQKNPVLFTGTPCQISGLYNYLKKDYDNLYTQDLICHGVPSRKVWEKYIEELESEEGKEVRTSMFRGKDNGWKEFQMEIHFEDTSNTKECFSKNRFMRLFLENMCLRPSCYNCSFKTLKRESDITLADFWGIDNIAKEMNDNKGTSLVIVHSLKGKELFDKIKENIEYKEVNLEQSIKYNKSMIESVKLPRKRDLFFKELDTHSIKELDRKYTHVSILKKIKRKVIRGLKKLKLNK